MPSAEAAATDDAITPDDDMPHRPLRDGYATLRCLAEAAAAAMLTPIRCRHADIYFRFFFFFFFFVPCQADYLMSAFLLIIFDDAG